MNDQVPSKQEVRADIIKYGCDSPLLYAISEKDLDKLYNDKSNNISEDIFSHWEDIQEELRCMMAECMAEFA